MSLMAATWHVLLALAPWVLLGAAVAGVMHVILPRDFVSRHLGGGRSSVIKAVALGVPLPLCSCGVIPAGLGLRKDGATRGAAVGFVISTPQTGVDSVLVSAAFLGWPFALFKVAAASVMGLVGGWTTDRFVPEASKAQRVEPADAPSDRPTGMTALAREGWDHAVEVLHNIWGWLAIGVVVSAVLTAVVPPAAFAALTAYGSVVTMLVVLAISVPLYVCATASVPIAAALVVSGFPAGAALVFLMAGPATNVATIGAVYRSLGRRALGIYLGTLVVGSLAAGLVFDSVLTAGVVSLPSHGDHATVWATAGVFALLVAFARFAFVDVQAALRKRATATSDDAPQTRLTVEGLTCNGCARKLTTALLATDGVTAADVDHERGLAVVSGAASAQHLRTAVQGAGFGVAGIDTASPASSA